MEDILIQLARLVEEVVPPRRIPAQNIPNIQEVDWESVAKSIGTPTFFPQIDQIWGQYRTYQDHLADYYRENTERGDAD